MPPTQPTSVTMHQEKMKIQRLNRYSLRAPWCPTQARLGSRLAALAAALAVMAVPAAESALLSHQSLDTSTGLTLNNGAAITSGGQGKFGEALALDGTNDWAQVAGTPPVTGGAVRTISSWVFMDAGTGVDTVASFGLNTAQNGNVNGGKWDLDIDSTAGGIEVGVAGGRTNGTGLTGLTGNWMLIVSTLPVASGDISHVKTYLNGTVTATTATTTQTISTANANYYLGRTVNITGDIQYLAGRIDDVAVWDEALAAGEIKGLYDIGNSSELLYTAGVFDQLKQVHDAASGSVAIGGILWTYATGLSGSAGLTGGSGRFTLVLDEAADTGLTGAAMPEGPFAITSITAVGGGVWELTLVSTAGVTCELRSSTTLNFTPGTLVENLTQGNPGSDPGTIGGPNNSRVTLDGSGNAKVRMTLTGSPSDFVRAQTIP
jgi:hypothetical protein